MRTRLDEIVDEVSAEWVKNGMPGWLKLIAEMAFKHGIERANDRWRDIEDGMGEDIEPAYADVERRVAQRRMCKEHCQQLSGHGERRWWMLDWPAEANTQIDRRSHRERRRG